MARAASTMIKAVGVAVVLTVVPFMAGKLALDAYAHRQAETELAGMADRFLSRAERVVATTISSLRGLADIGALSCTPDNLNAFSDLVGRTAAISAVVAIDQEGFPMCTAPAGALERRALLPVAETTGSPVTLAIVRPIEEQSAESATYPLMIGWTASSGQRVAALIDHEALAIDPGPEFLRPYRAWRISIGEGGRWIASGDQALYADDPAGPPIMNVAAKSAVFPISIDVRVPVDVIFQPIHSLQLILTVGCVGLGVVMIMVAVWTMWRPEIAADDEFQRAVLRSEFVPYYQLVINIQNGEIEGCEMLARWIRADGTVVSPGQFMPYAETSEHIFEITRQLMRKSRDELGKFYGEHPEMKLSINLFAGHFDDRLIVEDVQEIFGGGPIRYEQLVFEVTERYPLRSIERARKIMSELRALGCGIALDDTGTGHGGLAYIQQLGIDIIKIDKMFVDRLGEEKSSSTIVDVLVELAQELGMGIVAEGVETDAQVDRLRELGVSAAQGYLIAPPLPGNLFLSLCETFMAVDAADAASAKEAKAAAPKTSTPKKAA